MSPHLLLLHFSNLFGHNQIEIEWADACAAFFKRKNYKKIKAIGERIVHLLQDERAHPHRREGMAIYDWAKDH
jgi:hypothetical protein